MFMKSSRFIGGIFHVYEEFEVFSRFIFIFMKSSRFLAGLFSCS